MNIDMFWIWIIVIFSTFIFQNHFTENITTWDITYTHTTDSMNYIAYGQDLVTSPGRTLSWSTAQLYMAQRLTKENIDNESVDVVVLAVHKDTSKRVFMPFWKHLN